MNLKQFKEAQVLFKQVDSIEKIIKNHKIGKDNEEQEFTENNDDFYGGKFFNIKKYIGYHSTGGGSCDLERTMITEYKDGSGAKYHLTKEETLRLQDFIRHMLNDRLDALREETHLI